MIDLLNDLTLNFVSLVHNFELQFVSLMFRVLPTTGTIVATGLNDWVEFSVNFREGSEGYTSVIGKSKADVWTLILGEWAKYLQYIADLDVYETNYEAYEILFAQWQIDVQTNPELVAPEEPAPPVQSWSSTLTILFEYVHTIGVK